MKAAQKFALITGIVYLVVGIFGFVPALVNQPASVDTFASRLEVISGYGYLFGVLPVNTALNIVHIVTGLIGLFACIALDSSRFFSGQLGIYYTALAILGLIPVANTFFGLFPIFGLDIVLHGVTGLLGIYFGFLATPSLLTLFQREMEEESGAGTAL